MLGREEDVGHNLGWIERHGAVSTASHGLQAVLKGPPCAVSKGGNTHPTSSERGGAGLGQKAHTGQASQEHIRTGGTGPPSPGMTEMFSIEVIVSSRGRAPPF